jgi:hypothetical protein
VRHQPESVLCNVLKVQLGADTKKANNNGLDPLTVASDEGHGEVVAYLKKL